MKGFTEFAPCLDLLQIYWSRLRLQLGLGLQLRLRLRLRLRLMLRLMLRLRLGLISRRSCSSRHQNLISMIGLV